MRKLEGLCLKVLTEVSCWRSVALQRGSQTTVFGTRRKEAHNPAMQESSQPKVGFEPLIAIHQGFHWLPSTGRSALINVELEPEPAAFGALIKSAINVEAG